MYSGMADVAALSGNKQYQSAIDNIWQNVVNRKMYITGELVLQEMGKLLEMNMSCPI